MKQATLKNLTLGALLVAATACGKEGSDSDPSRPPSRTPSPVREGDPTARPTSGRSGNAVPSASPTPTPLTPSLGEQKETCKEDTGSASGANLECICPGAAQGETFTARTGRCETPTWNETCKASGETFSAALDRRGVEDFVLSCLSTLHTFDGTTFSIEIPSRDAARVRDVAQILDSNAGVAPRGAAPALFKRPGWSSTFTVVYGDTKLDKRLVETRPYKFDPNIRFLPQSISRAIHVAGKAELSRLFKPAGSANPAPALPSASSLTQDDTRLLAPLFAALAQGPSTETVTTPELSGCQHLCTVRSRISKAASGKDVWREKILVWGQTFSDSLLLGDDPESPDARLILGVDGAVSAIEIVDTSFNGGFLDRKKRLFDSNANLLGEHDLERLHVSAVEALQASKGLESLGAAPVVVACDSSFDVGESNVQGRDAILFGPFASTDPFGKGSLFGWDANESSSFGRFIGGASNPRPGEPKITGFHDDLVAHQEKLRVIPVVGNQCVPGSSLLETIDGKTKGRARVVASMTSSFQNEADCRERYGKALRDGPQLWVVTSGLSSLPGRENFRCPQLLGASNNLLVVGSALRSTTPSAGHLVGRSDTGEDYLDLSVANIDQQGATAAVAATAALIQSRHGLVLSNAHIRSALLLSVDLPKEGGRWKPLASRSGGFFNETRALETAAAIATKLSAEQRARFGADEARVILASLGIEGAEADARIELLTTRKGLVP